MMLSLASIPLAEKLGGKAASFQTDSIRTGNISGITTRFRGAAENIFY
jgi:hypothetical protein